MISDSCAYLKDSLDLWTDTHTSTPGLLLLFNSCAFRVSTVSPGAELCKHIRYTHSLAVPGSPFLSLPGVARAWPLTSSLVEKLGDRSNSPHRRWPSISAAGGPCIPLSKRIYHPLPTPSLIRIPRTAGRQIPSCLEPARPRRAVVPTHPAPEARRGHLLPSQSLRSPRSPAFHWNWEATGLGSKGHFEVKQKVA